MTTDYKCGLKEGDTIKVISVKEAYDPCFDTNKTGSSNHIDKTFTLKEWANYLFCFLTNDENAFSPYLYEFKIIEKEDDELITVCSKCFRACCWHGYFMCDEAYSAGIIEMEKSKLIKMNLEHESYMTNNNY